MLKECTFLGRFWSPYLASRASVFEFLRKWMQNICVFIYTYDWMMKAKTRLWHWCYFQFHGSNGTRSQFTCHDMICHFWAMEKLRSFHVVEMGSRLQFWSFVLLSVLPASGGGCRGSTPETWIWCRLAGNWS